MAYLSTIKDGSTNEILAYNLSNRSTLDIVTKTIHKLIKNSNIKLSKDVFIHSDQRSNYTSPKFQQLLKKYNLGQSMSRRGNCWNNAPQESFFWHMKGEIDYKNYSTLTELENLIDNHMNYYNNHRYQWNLNKLTPVQYRNQLIAVYLFFYRVLDKRSTLLKPFFYILKLTYSFNKRLYIFCDPLILIIMNIMTTI